MPFTLPELPYKKDALAPHISARTLDFHHGKHHNAYVKNLNKLIEKSDLTGETLEAIIRKTTGNPEQSGIFNNAAQVWNHTFFWHSAQQQGTDMHPIKIVQRTISTQEFRLEISATFTCLTAILPISGKPLLPVDCLSGDLGIIARR
ncbi:MAG: hypothetical protein V2J08_14110 [Desulfotignum sp.]|jgi:superoxide dismutase|nr:hypothetical protein [Desulfotignum sp.]